MFKSVNVPGVVDSVSLVESASNSKILSSVVLVRLASISLLLSVAKTQETEAKSTNKKTATKKNLEHDPININLH